MTWESVRFRERATALTQEMAALGLIDEQAWESRTWATAFQEVPRHLFVPDQAYAAAYGTRDTSRPIDRKANPTDWWNAIYSNSSIITQRDDGATPPGDTSGTATCSLSCPSIALTFLNLLDLRDHHRVLEVGTGTGWSAAVLAWRVGDQNVTSIEVDEVLADTAATNLSQAGFAPTLITGDGADGHPDRAPYDRIHVTAGVRNIPHAWIEQTRPGGLIVLPYMPAPTADQGGQQLALTVLDDGTAVGRFFGGAGFMMLRDQRRTTPAGPFDTGRTSTTRFDPRTLKDLTGRRDGAMLMLAALAPDILVDAEQVRHGKTWRHTVQLRDLGGTSSAVCATQPGAAEYDVAQYGPRNLWDELYDAYMQWVRIGQPGPERFGMTVRKGSHYLWLDHPTKVLTP